MFKNYLLPVLLFVSLFVSGQSWTDSIYLYETNKGEPTFFEIEEAFDKYWDSYEVNNKGYYKSTNGEMVKAPGWKQFNRWAWDIEGQINAKTGLLPKETAQQVYDNFAKSSLKSSNFLNSSNWKQLGPNNSLGGYSGIGRVNCIAFHPNDNNTYWVGAPAGGLWVTADDGNTWSCLTDSNNVLGISDIIIPSDYELSKTIYIATGDKDGWDNNSIGVLKSTDAGQTWNATGLVFSLSERKMVSRLLLNPNDDDIIIAATSDGVYKTIDGGVNWDIHLSTIDFIDMEYKPSSYSTLYGSTKGIGIGNGKIYRSIDSGLNWVEVYSTLGSYRIELAIAPSNSSVVYAVVVSDDDGLFGIYKSINSGVDFAQTLNGDVINLLGWDADGQDDGGQGWYDLAIAVSPINENSVVVGGVNGWRSTDGGVNWSIITHWWGENSVPVVHADKHGLVYRSNGDLFECNDGGVYYSNDDGTTFVDKTNGMIISQMYKLGLSALDKNEVITGLQDNGTKLFANGNWFDVKGGDGGECVIDYTNSDIQYGSYINGQISRTSNSWVTSQEIQPTDAGDGAWITPYIIDPKENETLYAGYADVWKTVNSGDSWIKISTINTTDKLRTITISPSNTSVIYVADNTHIWKTLYGGGSWLDITNTLPVLFSYIKDIAVKNDDENTVWVTISGYNSDGVYETTDGGDSWINISAGLPQLPVYSIVQDTLVNSIVCLYVGTELGVYFKKGDSDWVEYKNGLPNVKIGEIDIFYDRVNVDSSRLRVATYGRGLWESKLYIEKPVVGFSANITVQNIGGAVHFTDTSFNYPIEWNWLFEAGTPSVSNEQNPKIIYDTLGVFDVTLIVKNYSGNDTLVKLSYITIEPTEPPVAGFESDRISVEVNQKVQFMDTSLKVPTSWKWVFEGGNPSVSTEQNPEVVYSNEGIYDIKLIVENAEGQDSVVIYSYITVGPNSLFDNNKHEIKIYPNPSSDLITVELANDNYKKVIIELYDLNGKLIRSVVPDFNTSIKHQIYIGDFEEGNYILRVNTDNDYAVFNIVKI